MRQLHTRPLCATSYGAGGAIASPHLGFHKRHFSPDESFAIHMAGLALTERLMSLTAPPPAAAVRPRRANATAWRWSPKARPTGRFL